MKKVCVGGRGFYQEWGKEAQELHPGDVVNIPVGVKHWLYISFPAFYVEAF